MARTTLDSGTASFSPRPPRLHALVMGALGLALVLPPLFHGLSLSAAGAPLVTLITVDPLDHAGSTRSDRAARRAAARAHGRFKGFREALRASRRRPYFLWGVLALGVAGAQSGLAARVARHILERARGRPLAMYVPLVLAMPVLTFILPSATTRSGILVHIYEEVFGQARVAPGAGIVKAVMLALSSINRLASTALLTGGITPVMAAAIIGGMSWTGWLALLAVPYYALLALGAVMTWALYRRGFTAALDRAEHVPAKPLSGAEWRTSAVVAGTGLLWLTDAWHHLDPTLPAMLALVALLTPGFGTLTWSDLDRHVGCNFCVSGPDLAGPCPRRRGGVLARRLVGSCPGWGARSPR